jgi:hypothetical protein
MILHIVEFMISFFKTLNSGPKMSIIQDQNPSDNESHHHLNQCILKIVIGL